MACDTPANCREVHLLRLSDSTCSLAHSLAGMSGCVGVVSWGGVSGRVLVPMRECGVFLWGRVVVVEFFAGLIADESDVVTWAREREAEGWHGLNISDHLASNGQSYPHLLVTLAQVAAVTETVKVTSGYANTLIRNPVDFAHAAMTLQQASGGRFEAGLGAGWAQEEAHYMGIDFPDGPGRARRFEEAARIVSEVLRTGGCHFSGEFHTAALDDVRIDVDAPPPFVVAVGGPWTCANVAPLADRVEVVPNAVALRSGTLNLAGWADGTPERIKQLVGWVKDANPDAAIGIGCFAAAGDNPAVESISRVFGDGPLSGMAGEPAAVADTLHRFSELGIDRCLVMGLVPGTYETLAHELL